MSENFRYAGLLLAAVAMNGNLFAAVTLQIKAENPSSMQQREVAVRSLLPRPVGPEDVVEPGDMEVYYDEKSRQYGVRADVVLEPGAEKVFEVVIEDVWLIPDATLDAYERRARDLAERLAEDDYGEEAALLSDSIVANIEAIRERQAANTVPEVTPAAHIGAYNENRLLLDEVEADLEKLKALLAIVSDKLLLERTPKGPSPNLSTIWLVVFIIITFIGVLSTVFFFTWSVQLQKIRRAEELEGSSRKAG